MRARRRWPGSSARRAGSRVRGIVPDDAEALERALGEAIAEDDLVVVSAGSSVGARDLTATVVERLGEIVCHGLAMPGQADAAGRLRRRAADRPAGQSALRARRLPPRRRPARAHGRRRHRAAAGATVRAALARDVPSAAGRLDVVQVALRDGVATPRFGSSALLGPMAGADGYVCVPSRTRGCPRARRSTSCCTDRDAARPLNRPSFRDVPAGEALARWLESLEGRRLDVVEVALADALGRVTAAPVWALRSSPAYDAAAMDGIAVRAADTLGATETAPRAVAARSRSSTPATRCPRAATRS